MLRSLLFSLQTSQERNNIIIYQSPFFDVKLACGILVTLSFDATLHSTVNMVMVTMKIQTNMLICSKVNGVRNKTNS